MTNVCVSNNDARLMIAFTLKHTLKYNLIMPTYAYILIDSEYHTLLI